MKELKLFKKLVVTLLVAGLSGPAIVLAGLHSNFESDEVKVSFTNLNLDSEEDLLVLYRRLQTASKEICGIKSSTSILARSSLRGGSLRCYEKTLTRSVGKVGNQDLTRIHAE